jgi:hypothetical protein
VAFDTAAPLFHLARLTRYRIWRAALLVTCHAWLFISVGNGEQCRSLMPRGVVICDAVFCVARQKCKSPIPPAITDLIALPIHGAPMHGAR